MGVLERFEPCKAYSSLSQALQGLVMEGREGHSGLGVASEEELAAR